MLIRFDNVTPAPLAGVTDFTTDIWGKDRTFEAGKRYNLIAPSGKGKTTFMHLICGLRDDFSGSVTIGSSDSRTIRPHQWAQLRKGPISIVYQDLRLFLTLTARENLAVKLALYPGRSLAGILEMTESLAVSQLLDKPCRILSYGERQRIAVTRALIQPFDWLLLDEPFSHLDDENTRRACSLIEQEVNKRHAGLIVSSLGQNDWFTYDATLRL